MEAQSRPKRTAESFLLAAVLWLIPLGIVALGAQRWFPALASEHGADIDLMMRYLLVTVGALLLAGHLALGFFIWRFAGQDRVSLRMASAKAERRWSLIPVVVMTLVAEGGVLALGLPVWGKLAGAAPADAVAVEVTAEQFAWNVRYPGPDGKFGRTDAQLLSLSNPLGLDRQDTAARDDVHLLNEVFVPVGRPVRVRLRSKDTLHSFFLPFQRIKQDVVPGMTIEIWFVPNKVGTYEIACAELCGFGHYQMRGLLQVLPSDEFEQWLREQPTFF
ncbi:MAG: hypothetical protein A3H27_15705 [Acidobacteria bacterium RIFCSPLOWO2_02_FULL_59_13]|nr:MAG: hypothetical protein A3H27_15705 [Acidobacteria bacterium RIFCSPLOWO2_02_FULL_59_13]